MSLPIPPISVPTVQLRSACCNNALPELFFFVMRPRPAAPPAPALPPVPTFPTFPAPAAPLARSALAFVPRTGIILGASLFVRVEPCLDPTPAPAASPPRPPPLCSCDFLTTGAETPWPMDPCLPIKPPDTTLALGLLDEVSRRGASILPTLFRLETPTPPPPPPPPPGATLVALVAPGALVVPDTPDARELLLRACLGWEAWEAWAAAETLDIFDSRDVLDTFDRASTVSLDPFDLASSCSTSSAVARFMASSNILRSSRAFSTDLHRSTSELLLSGPLLRTTSAVSGSVSPPAPPALFKRRSSASSAICFTFSFGGTLLPPPAPALPPKTERRRRPAKAPVTGRDNTSTSLNIRSW